MTPLTFNQILELYEAEPLASSPSSIREVVVIAGSSRSGSSLLFHLLTQTGRFWSPLGEETPLQRLAGFSRIQTQNDSDHLEQLSEEQSDFYWKLLLHDLGRPTDEIEWSPRLKAQIAWRLTWQWPERLDFSKQSLPRLQGEELLEALSLPKEFYDVSHARRDSGDLAKGRQLFIEEPPYVVPSARELPSEETLPKRPLLLKTSTHAYRLSWLKKLFPKAKYKWIFLTRHPAGTINGLMDGWLSNAFHSHNLEGFAALRIEGYTDHSPQGDKWWKFDFPPSAWNFTDASLARVCAEQWKSAYQYLLFGLKEEESVFRVKYEDLINPKISRETLSRLYDFLGFTPEKILTPHESRPVMTSKGTPRERWQEREKDIVPLLKEPSMIEVAEQLGYELSS